MRKRMLLALAAVLVTAALALLFYTGRLQFNYPSDAAYPIRGVDVSAYQGEIDWPTLAGQGIDFAFIKATEGSKFVDERFSFNWENAAETNLRIGAYHFFSFDSPGSTQAENFIRTVDDREDMLPPVVDVEFYGKYRRQRPEDIAGVREELHTMLEMLTQAYGVRPILYVTRASYDLLIAGEFAEYDIWFRNILRAPRLSDGREWVFWQYSDRGRLEGYDGVEKFIDLNVFYGSKEKFESYGKTTGATHPRRYDYNCDDQAVCRHAGRFSVCKAHRLVQSHCFCINSFFYKWKTMIVK